MGYGKKANGPRDWQPNGGKWRRRTAMDGDNMTAEEMLDRIREAATALVEHVPAEQLRMFVLLVMCEVLVDQIGRIETVKRRTLEDMMRDCGFGVKAMGRGDE